MSWRLYPRLIGAFAAVLLSATLGLATLNQDAPQAFRSLAGQLLIASPEMGDPRFARTVILMVTHDRNGAFGLVINRPIGERPIAQVFEALSADATGIEGSIRVFAGGPVETRQGFVLHSGEYRRPETYVVNEQYAMTASLDALRDIAAKKGPKKAIVAFGYSGWSPGQLENELKMNGWLVAPADERLVFDDDREQVWDKAMARRPRDI
jgi:putative transcriptional regulator